APAGGLSDRGTALPPLGTVVRPTPVPMDRGAAHPGRGDRPRRRVVGCGGGDSPGRSRVRGRDDPVGERGTRRDPELRTGPRSRRPHFELGRGNRIGPVESGCAGPARGEPQTVRRTTPVTVPHDRVSRPAVTRT